MPIAHLSDPHLRPAGHLYRGLVDSNAMFAAAIRQVNALDPAPDLVLLIGDLVDEGKAADYAEAGRALAAPRRPLLAIPAITTSRRRSVPASPPTRIRRVRGRCIPRFGDQGPVRIVALDVTVPGEHHGDMDDASCDGLDETLREEPARPFF